MIKDTNNVNISGRIFWSKLDEHATYTTLRLGLDIGEGTYNRVFVGVSNPNEKAHQFIKNDNKAVVLGAWLDTWVKEDGSMEIQVKAYDSNIQFYMPNVAIPKLNEVFIYGTVKEIKAGKAIVDCTGARNPKTNQWTHRIIPVDLGENQENSVGKKVVLRGTLGLDDSGENKSKLKVFVDYDKINIMG